MAHFKEWIPLLRNVFLFSHCSRKQLYDIAEAMTLVSYPKGTTLIEENAKDERLYVILSGSVRIMRRPNHHHTHKESSPPQEAVIGRGDVLGEMSLLANQPFPYSAVTESPVEVLVLKKEDFDQILEQHSELGVQLSRVLSSQLAMTQEDEGRGSPPARRTAVVTGLSYRDQVLFGIALGLAMAEQMRRRTLLLVIDEGPCLTSKSLGLETSSFPESGIREGAHQDPQKLGKYTLIHQSGLELLEIPLSVFHSSSFAKGIGPFLVIIRELYDHCLIVLPPERSESTTALLEDVHQTAFVRASQTSSDQARILEALEKTISPYKKCQQVWLATQSTPPPAYVPPGNRIPWNSGWARRFMESGSAFLPLYDHRTRRKVDRLARVLGQCAVGFAMGSGAAFGYAMIGMLKVFEREGIYPDMVAGTSMGALLGSFYASGKTPDEIEAIAKTITKKRLWKMADFGIPRSGILPGKGVLQFLHSVLGDKTFFDMEVPFTCVSTDIQTGREILLNEGLVAQAVRASLSLPIFFRPFYLNGRYLVDGGLVNPVPISVTHMQGANILLSANLTMNPGDRDALQPAEPPRRFPSFMQGPAIPGILMKTIYTMQYEIASAQADLADVVLDIHPTGLWWWDFHRSEDIIKLGERSAEENMEKIKSKLPFFSNACQVQIRRRGRKIL